VHIIFLGAPGAGKGTQAANPARELHLAHIATGDLFRQAIEAETELGRQVSAYVTLGALVPDRLTISVVLECLATPDSERGAILDGFPRTLAQAKALDKALAEQSKAIDRVIYIKVNKAELLRRLSQRWVCRNCQTPYNMVNSPSESEGKCKRCGGELYQRPDDTLEAIKKRLEVYFTETAPLIDYYTAADKLVEIDGEGGIEKVSRRILAVIREESQSRRA
jgi:adenylate kinase